MTGYKSRNLLGQDLVDVWQVHLNAVLCLVDTGRHPVELACLVELGDGVTVELQLAKRGAVGRAF